MNENCLAGIKCPECGNEDRFHVYARIWVELTDDGTDPYADGLPDHGAYYDDRDWFRCPQCGKRGPMKEFKANE